MGGICHARLLPGQLSRFSAVVVPSIDSTNFFLRTRYEESSLSRLTDFFSLLFLLLFFMVVMNMHYYCQSSPIPPLEITRANWNFLPVYSLRACSYRLSRYFPTFGASAQLGLFLITFFQMFLTTVNSSEADKQLKQSKLPAVLKTECPVDAWGWYILVLLDFFFLEMMPKEA